MKKQNTVKKSETKKSTEQSKVMPLCACGCGKHTKGGKFIPGHDAKLVSHIMTNGARGKACYTMAKELVHMISNGDITISDAIAEYKTKFPLGMK